MSLSGKNAIVTGGAQGIGRAISLRLAKDGANVALLDLNESTGRETASEINQLGVKALSFACDATQYDQVKSAVDQVHQQWNTIDILINNAGIDRSKSFVDTDQALWDLIINVNYRSFLIASHVCIPYMIRQNSGNIVSLGSDAGRVGNPGEVLYCGTKAAIMASSKALAKELARYNIRVNAVAPGPVKTALWDQLHDGEKGRKVTEAVERAIPMRRLGTPEDVADVIAFFCQE
ncbi:MAG: SDR family oxidoreductase [Deltaproteobacteria bacterium]|nr:SDR family oxidoreductase [Deltaproteobacteria bacterium]